MERQRREELARRMQFEHQQAQGMAGDNSPEEVAQAPAAPRAPIVRDGRKVGRNDPCPCGSGKKYKQCCGKIV